MQMLKTRRGCSSVKSNDTIDIYCTCRMPDTFGNVVECSKCKKWYHVCCVHVHKKAVQDQSLCVEVLSL